MLSTQSTNTARLFQLLFFAAGMFLCWEHEPTVKGFYADNQIYFYAAERVASGVPPHVSLVDHKHALCPMLSGAAIAVGRVVGIGDVMAVRLLSMSLAAGTVSLVFGLTLRLSRSFISAGLSALVVMAFVDYFVQATMGVRPQIFMAFFMVLALVAFADGKRARSGFYAACSFLSWQPALIVLGCLGLATLLERERWQRVRPLVAGAAVAVLAYEAYFLWHGALLEQLYQSYVMPSLMGVYKVKPFARSFDFLMKMGLMRADLIFIFPITLMLSLAAGLLWFLRYPRWSWDFLRENPLWTATLTCAYVTITFTFLNNQAYPDLFFIQPFIAVSSGLTGGWLAARAADVARRVDDPSRLVAWAVAGFCAYVIMGLVVQRRAYFSNTRGQNLHVQRQLAKQVDMLIDHHGSVWAIGCPHLLALERVENHVPYGLLIDPRVRSYMKQQAEPGAYRPLRDGELPAVILTSRGGERSAMPWFPTVYRRVELASFKQQGIRVWIRRPSNEKG